MGYRLLGTQDEPGLQGICISANEYTIYDGKGNARQSTTDRDFARQIVAANVEHGAYCLDSDNTVVFGKHPDRP